MYYELSIHTHIFKDYITTAHKKHLEYDTNLLIFKACSIVASWLVRFVQCHQIKQISVHLLWRLNIDITSAQTSYTWFKKLYFKELGS